MKQKIKTYVAFLLLVAISLLSASCSSVDPTASTEEGIGPICVLAYLNTPPHLVPTATMSGGVTTVILHEDPANTNPNLSTITLITSPSYTGDDGTYNPSAKTAAATLTTADFNAYLAHFTGTTQVETIVPYTPCNTSMSLKTATFPWQFIVH